MRDFSAGELTDLYRKKELSPVEVVEQYLEAIDRKNPDLFAYIFTTPELALEQARESEKRWQKGEPASRLDGVPLAVKDNILIKGIRCTAGSRILENYVASYDATVIRNLKKGGVVFLGKTNLDEFAMGSSTENSAFGITRNPHDPERVPGGSSGGSAVAVASNLCVASLGSDTGGSIRLPACFCGVYGLKPSYGRVSRYGLIAMASSLDQIGPLAKNIEDIELVFEIIKGKDSKDASQITPKETLFAPKEKITIGLPKEYFTGGLEDEVAEVIERTVKRLTELGFELQEVSLPHTEYALSSYYLTVFSEVSSNLARFDSVRYGKRKEKDWESFWQIYFENRGEYLGAEVKRRIILGTFTLSAGYYDAFYKKAQITRHKIREDFEKAFRKVDLIFAPVSPTLPFKIGEKINDPVKMYLSDIFTVPVNLAGLPALSVPVGRSSNGLPVGAQFIGPYFGEDLLFSVARRLKEDTSYEG